MNCKTPTDFLQEGDFLSIRDCIIKDIEAHSEWREEVSRGKMFGFLIIENSKLNIEKSHADSVVNNLQSSMLNLQYIKAYSGQILGRSDWEGYVPAIFDYLQPDGYFKTHEAEITLLNNKIKEAETLLPKGKRTREVEQMKQERKERSQALQRWLFSQFKTTPSASPQPSPKGEETPISPPMTEGSGEASLLDIFTDYARRTGSKQTVPPSGTGECCTPKLLHYANTHGLKALLVAEFWYGDSPKGVIRHHGQFYEPCQAKCMPLLWYMLPEGCKVYPFVREMPSPSIEILWEDPWFVAINKSAGLLSVPGKRNLPNAQGILNTSPAGGGKEGAFKAVHRLDMDTSGILLFAKTEEAFVKMQRLFAEKRTLSSSPLKGESSISKEYTTVLSSSRVDKKYPLKGENPISKEYTAIVQKSPFKGDLEGLLSLSLSPDFENRPMQRVDYEEGKEAITEYRFISEDRVLLYPLTGRTHQLRIHCAHPDGLGRQHAR